MLGISDSAIQVPRLVIDNTPDVVPPQSGGTETEAALQRILRSERFRKNVSLRQLLEYLVRRTLKGEGSQIKETTVAMDVFGRPNDFDSRIDNIVRVQAHRLRKLLTSYYEVEGANELIRFSIPRGGYIPHIETVTAGSASGEAVAVRVPERQPEIAKTAFKEERPPDVPPEKRSFLPSPLMTGLAFALGVLVCLAVVASMRMWQPEVKRAARSESAASGPLAAVWGVLLKPGVDCVVSYSNPVFLWSGENTGPRLLIPYSGPISVPPGARINISAADLNLNEGVLGKNPNFFFSDGWTGVGEVAAMQRITALLSPQVSLEVIRSRALTYSDVRASNVIFLGSPWANDMQKKIDLGATPLVNDNDGNILNLKPRAGEPSRFRSEVDPATHQITSTYGLFSVLPGLSPGTKVFISAGVNTYGTAGAIDFMTASAGVEEVMRQFGTADHQTLPDYFQIVVRSEMIRGEPAESRLVLARAVEQAAPSTVP